jgi:hypothetical protein
LAVQETGVTSLFVEVDDGGCFQVDVSHWPAGADIGRPDVVFSDYWPPRGWRMVSRVATNPERTFAVDLESESSLARFESDFGLYVAEKIEGLVAIHAALVVLGPNVLLIPGSSGRGKSTLAKAAFLAWHRVLTDEFSLVDPTTGFTTGWGRPIRERLAAGGIKRIPIEQGDAVLPTHVIKMSFVKDHPTGALSLEPITGGEVAMELLANTVCAQSRTEESFQASVVLARQVQGFAGTRGEADQALKELEDWLGTQPVTPSRA